MRRLCALLLGGILWTGIALADEPLQVSPDRPADILHLKLEVEVFLKEKKVNGIETIDFVPFRPIRTIKLNAIDHEIVKIQAGPAGSESRRELHYDYDGKTLDIDFGEDLPRGEQHQVTIEYRIREPKGGLYFFQPSETEPKVPLMVWSQGEPTLSRYWFPNFDWPTEKQTTELIAVVEPGFEVLSNGELLSRQPTADKKKMRFHWKQEKPHVSYLVTMVVGKFNIQREQWRNRPIAYYVPPDKAAESKATFGRTLEMLDYFSDRFGIEYPWEKYSQVVVEQFTAGGMENTSATTLYEQIMHDDRALIDSDPDWLIAHELGHQWWGDLVTCKDWSHLWLNEGFATYCEVLWAEHKLGMDERDYRLLAKSRDARSGAALTRPIIDRRYLDPGAMFDERVYPKGGWVLHMLRHKLGDADFFSALKRYGIAYSYRTVETKDLREVFEQLTGLSLERFFYDWTERAGHPIVKVTTSYSVSEKLAKVVIKQEQKEAPFEFPLRIEFVTAKGEPVAVEKIVEDADLTLYVPVPERPLGVRIDPEFSLLAEIKEEKSQDWWEWQALKAPTIIERIRVAEHLADSENNSDRELVVKMLENDQFYGVRVEAAKALGKSKGDIARTALLRGLKQDNAKVRRACADALGKFVDDSAVEKALAEKNDKGDDSYYVEATVLESHAKVQRQPDLKPLLAALKKPSHGEVIRQAALREVAKSHDPQALDTLLEWSQRGKPRECRRTAIRGIATYFAHNDVPESRGKEIADVLLKYLNKEEPHIRHAAVDALRDIGKPARPAMHTLASLADHDPDRRVRAAARAAVQHMKSDTPPSEELTRLRKEVDDLRKRNEDLEGRLHKLESK
jgi:aminopeptidase N